MECVRSRVVLLEVLEGPSGFGREPDKAEGLLRTMWEQAFR